MKPLFIERAFLLAHLGQRDERVPATSLSSVFEFAGRFYPCRIDILQKEGRRSGERVLSCKTW